MVAPSLRVPTAEPRISRARPSVKDIGALHRRPDDAPAGLKPRSARETWLLDTTAPQHFVDIRPTLAAKQASLELHQSQNPAMLLAEAERLIGHHEARTGFPAEGCVRPRML